MAVIDRSARTYLPTDLTGTRRREFIADARAGVARLRDTDGTTLALLPSADLDVLSETRKVALAYLALENALSRPRRERRTTDFGELAWAEPLSDGDLEELRAEVRDGLPGAITSGSFDALNDELRAWRATAQLASDPQLKARIRQRLDDEAPITAGDPRALPSPE